MKNLIFLAIALLTLQAAKSQTSLQEYTYINKGLKEDVETGRDIKSGYTLKLIASEVKVSWGKDWKGATLYTFAKGKENKAYVLMGKDSYGSVVYRCIPTADASQEIWNQTSHDIFELGEKWHAAFLWALVKVSSQKLIAAK